MFPRRILRWRRQRSVEVQQPNRRCTAWPTTIPSAPIPRLHIIALLFSNTVVFPPNHIDLCYFPPICFGSARRRMKSFKRRWRRRFSTAAQLTLLFFSLVERKQPAMVSFKVRCHPRAAAAAADEWSEFWRLAPIRMQLCFLSSGLGLPSWTDGGTEGGCSLSEAPHMRSDTKFFHIGKGERV